MASRYAIVIESNVTNSEKNTFVKRTSSLRFKYLNYFQYFLCAELVSFYKLC